MYLIRVVFGLVFLAWSIVAAVYTFSFAWIAAIGIGWSGKNMGVLEFVWLLKAPLLITLLSITTSMGLFFNKRWGSLLGLALSIVAMFLCSETMLTGIGDGSIAYSSELLTIFPWLFLSFVVTVVFLKLVNSYQKIGASQMVILGSVISSVLLSYYTMF
ncbi:hypothetical protein [Aureisphaera sp.]